MEEDTYHRCPFCNRMVKDRHDPAPRLSDTDLINGYSYSRCPHCGRWIHSESDCCPTCMMPYCDGSGF